MRSSSASLDRLAVDAGPLIALARLNLLYLPSQMFERVLITDVVAAECLANPNYPEGDAIQSALKQGMLEQQTWSEPQSAGMWNLDMGEASTIDVAIRLEAAILVDDRAARRIAQKFELPTVGTCGLLLLAKRQGKVDEIKPLLNRLVNSGYYLGSGLVNQILSLAGES
ncbi:MAG: DUF3368 domain-containing protein [Wenzhouxiangella sp.]|nr:MAG: DUF3368 domain-containing protein [Wenzhouxiangella sp.]